MTDMILGSLRTWWGLPYDEDTDEEEVEMLKEGMEEDWERLAGTWKEGARGEEAEEGKK
jgi:hypothetical protein